MFTKNQDKPWQPVANMEPGSILVFCEYMKDPTNLKLVKYFWVSSASNKTSFGVCSSSKLMQLKFVEKKIAWKRQLVNPQDSYKGD